MNIQRTRLWNTLEAWDATVFLVAGALLSIAMVINAVDVVTSIPTQQGVLLAVEGATGFGGVLFSFVGLLALYPRLRGPSPRLAQAGVLLAAGPATFFASLLVACLGLAPLLGFPSVKTVIPSFALIAATILVSYAIAVTLVGLACLRTGVPSRTVGGLLLVVAATWFGFFGPVLVFRYDIPTWVTFLQTAAMAGPFLAIGVRLRAASNPVGRTRPATEPTAR